MKILDIIYGVSKNEITQEQAIEAVRNKKAQLIDVRNSAEYRMEHLTPCVNIDVSEKDFSDKLKNYSKDSSYILYCKTGLRAKKALKKMTKGGFSNVKIIKGGIQQWSGSKRVK